MGRKSFAALIGTACVVTILACGKDRPPVADGTNTTVGPPTVGGGGGGFLFDAGPTKPPSCGVQPDGTLCDCLDVPLLTDAPAIYFVLDRSGSMREADKWNQVRVTVAKIMRNLGPRARFGAMTYPTGNDDSTCLPGSEVMSVRDGDPPSSSDGPTTLTLLQATRIQPIGGTPTSATLDQARSILNSVPGKRYVILATDGAPNCNDAAECPAEQCQLNIENFNGCNVSGPNCCEDVRARGNCNDRTATLDAIRALKLAAIPTYVVGLPGTESQVYASLLNEMAQTGGTAQPGSVQYFQVSTSTEQVMLTALKKVAAQIVGTCVFTLKETPISAGHVNVYLDDEILPYEPVNGWTIEDKTVRLEGIACSRVISGDVLDVRIIAGCPRFEPR